MEKNKKKKGIYSLVHESLDGTKKSYLRMLDDEGKLKEKFPLTTLDALTTSCENMKELLIYARTLHNPKKNSTDNWLDGTFYIEYKYDGEIKTLDVVFSDNLLISQMAVAHEGEYYMKNEINTYVMARRLIDIKKHNSDLFNYLKEKGYMGKDIPRLIDEYLNYDNDNYHNVNEAIRVRDIIKNKLEEYKLFRDINVGIYNYNKEKEIRQKIETLKEAKTQLINEFGPVEEKPSEEKVKRILPPKGSQLSFNDIGHNI